MSCNMLYDIVLIRSSFLLMNLFFLIVLFFFFFFFFFQAEDGIRDGTVTGVQTCALPIFASKWQFLPYIERGIHQFNRVDVCNVGGLTEAMKVAGWSEAHYVDLKIGRASCRERV